MRKTYGKLADGREIIFFDSADAPAREIHDPRPLPPSASTTELRHDPLVDEWIAIAAHRQDRTHLPPADECPLCPSTGARATEVPVAAYEVVVFENRFPALSRPHGRCEVVCFSDDHNGSFAGLTPERVRLVMAAWADRTAALTELPEVQQVYPFENRGEEIGVTLHHPHGQIYGFPFVPPRTERMLAAARGASGDLFGDFLAAERSGPRVIAATEHWTAFVPAAARWPVEVQIWPHRRVPDLAALTEAERADFAPLYLDVLRRCDALYGRPLPYIAAWNQAPKAARDLMHLHLQLFSIRRSATKLKYLAGTESGMGAFIGDVLPEAAARKLREAV